MRRDQPSALFSGTWQTGCAAGTRLFAKPLPSAHGMCLGRLFAGTVLAGLEPGALLLTGDLVDGKTALGRGHQLKTEWEVCSRSWETTHSET